MPHVDSTSYHLLVVRTQHLLRIPGDAMFQISFLFQSCSHEGFNFVYELVANNFQEYSPIIGYTGLSYAICELLKIRALLVVGKLKKKSDVLPTTEYCKF